jgi:nucleoside-diphosphate-sugar epimerase
MKILVTGAFGTVGRHAVPALMAQGHKIRCLTLNPTEDDRVSVEHFTGPVEMVPGDLRRVVDLAPAVEGVDMVVHLAGINSPACDDDPAAAGDVNVGGTDNLMRHVVRQKRPPRVLLASTARVLGYADSSHSPRKPTDKPAPTDVFGRQKLAAERVVQGATGVSTCVLRLAQVPALSPPTPHPAMFDIDLDGRIELLHPADAGLAIANAVKTEEAWGHTWLVGGGSRCQLTFRQYLTAFMDAFGVGMLPDDCFSGAHISTDWLVTDESQRVLDYQRHSFEDIVREVVAAAGWRRIIGRLLAPMARARMVAMARAAQHHDDHDAHGAAHDDHGHGNAAAHGHDHAAAPAPKHDAAPPQSDAHA